MLTVLLPQIRNAGYKINNSAASMVGKIGGILRNFSFDGIRIELPPAACVASGGVGEDGSVPDQATEKDTRLQALSSETHLLSDSRLHKHQF